MASTRFTSYRTRVVMLNESDSASCDLDFDKDERFHLTPTVSLE